MIRKLTTSALVIAAAVAPAIAMAQPPITVVPPGSFRTIVSYKDLNLSSVDDVATLKTRVASAARDGCNGLYKAEREMEALGTSYTVRNACFRASMAGAVSQIDRATQLAQAGRPVGSEIMVAASR